MSCKSGRLLRYERELSSCFLHSNKELMAKSPSIELPKIRWLEDYPFSLGLARILEFCCKCFICIRALRIQLTYHR